MKGMEYMRKLSMALAVVMLFVSCLCFTASAAGTLNVAVSAPGEVEAGGELTLTVNFSGNTGFSTLGVKLTYPESFTLIQQTDGSESVDAVASALVKEKFILSMPGMEGGETYVFYHDAEKRTISFVGATMDDITAASGDLFTVKFKAPDKAAADQVFKVEMIETAYNNVGDTLTGTVTDGNVGVTEVTYVLGDIDGVNGVTTADAMLAFFAATKKISLTETQALAANVITADSGITTADSMRIFYYATRKITSF